MYPGRATYSVKMEDEVDTTIYLSSAESKEYYPNNNPSCFSNWLKRPLKFNRENEYEVGVSLIIMESAVQYEPILSEEDEAKILLYKTVGAQRMLTVPKSGSLDEWLNAVNFQIIMTDFPARLLMESDDNNNIIAVDIENHSGQ